ncbi:PilZ domain-containing protein [Clostridium perfringens]
MISTNQKRKHIRVGTNLVAKVSLNNNNRKIVHVKDVSAAGAKIESRNNFVTIGDVMNIEFKYKNVLYDILCKVVRTEPENNTCGIKFYFKGDNNSDKNTNKYINSNKNKLYQDILEEYFLYTDCFR